MYCNHCGAQLPQGAKFCGNCGKMVAQPAQGQQSYAPPQYPSGYAAGKEQKTAPYTVPVDQTAGYAQQSQNVNSYQPGTNSWNASNQQSPVYTQPVDPTGGNQQTPYTVPLEGTGYQSNSGSIPPYQHSQVNANGYYGSQSQQPMQPKRQRKLPVVLAAAAAVLLLLLGIAIGSSKDTDKEKPETPTTQTGGNKEGQFTKKEDQEQAENGLRYTDEGFLFDDQELPGYYEAALKKNGTEFTVSDSYATTGTGYQWNVLEGSAPVIYFGTYRDPDTGKITRVYAGHNILTEGYEEITYEEFEAILYIIEAAHGEMTKEQWDYINNQQPTFDTDTIKIYEYELDGLKIKMTATENTFSVDVCVQEYQLPKQEENQPQSTTGSTAASGTMDYLDIGGALAKHPEGTLRFDSKSFKMTNDELVSLFQHGMNQDGVYLHLAKRTAQENGKYHYRIENDEGDDVGYVVVTTDTTTNKVKEASFTYNYQPDEDEHSYGTNAVLCFIEAGHGNMTDKQWGVIANAQPFAEKEEYTMIAYKLDGMKATLTIREDRMFISLKLGS